ncbi:MAG: DUF1853 family protein [Psychrobacter sp.]|nr:DUF1853 family protein [Psychrobacter sp.]
MSEPALPLSTSTLANNAPWEQFKRPYIRDLAYVLACPNVLTRWIDFSPQQTTHTIEVHSSNFWLTQFAAYQQRLHELDNTTAYQELTRYLIRRPSPRRLGFHFEGLLSFWLTDGYTHGLHAYEMLASNVQLYQGKQTVGELDLILYNHQDKLTEHWELAIKFFMGSAPFAPSSWVGINSNDNLQRKMTHMQTKQFRAVWVDTDTGADTGTEEHGRVKIDKRYAVIKGRFFLPINQTNFVYPQWLEPSFPMHEWCDKQDINNLATLDSSKLRQATYVEWFTKRDVYDERVPKINWVDKLSPATGLYFESDRAIVIYPHVSDHDDSKL